MERLQGRVVQFAAKRYQPLPFLRTPSRSSAWQTRTTSRTLHRPPIEPSSVGGLALLGSFYQGLLSYRALLVQDGGISCLSMLIITCRAGTKLLESCSSSALSITLRPAKAPLGQ